MSQPNKRHEAILKQYEIHQINIGGIVYEMVKFNQALTALATLQGKCDEKLSKYIQAMIDYKDTITLHEATIASLKEEYDEELNSAVIVNHELVKTIASLKEEVERLKELNDYLSDKSYDY